MECLGVASSGAGYPRPEHEVISAPSLGWDREEGRRQVAGHMEGWRERGSQGRSRCSWRRQRYWKWVWVVGMTKRREPTATGSGAPTAQAYCPSRCHPNHHIIGCLCAVALSRLARRCSAVRCVCAGRMCWWRTASRPTWSSWTRGRSWCRTSSTPRPSEEMRTWVLPYSRGCSRSCSRRRGMAQLGIGACARLTAPVRALLPYTVRPFSPARPPRNQSQIHINQGIDR